MKPAPAIFFFLLCFLCSYSPSNDELYYRAERLIEKKQYTKAIAVYDRILKKNSKMQDAFYMKGYCYLQDSNYDQALHFFDVVRRLKGLNGGSEMIFEMNPNSPFASEEDLHQVSMEKLYYQSGVARYYLDELEDSYADFQQSVYRNYKKANCYAWLGLILTRLDSMDKACRFLHKAKDLGEPEAEGLLKQYCAKIESK